MGNQVRVTKSSEIPAAVGFVEQHTATLPAGSAAHICSLICEELLLRLLNTGCTEINVSIKGFLFRHVEICAKGDRTDAYHAGQKTGEDRIGTQINDCLLEQYADYFTFKYQNGVNLYMVFFEKKGTVDLTDEIYGFYKKMPIRRSHINPCLCCGILHATTGAFFLSPSSYYS